MRRVQPSRSRVGVLASAAVVAVLLATLPLDGLAAERRRMALTFDDLPAQRAHALPEARIARITDRLVSFLAAERIPAIGFVNQDKLEVDGRSVPGRVAYLEAWLDAGLELGNHTYSHPDLHRVAVEEYLGDIERGEPVIRSLLEARGARLRYFRHPFLHTGRDLETRVRVETFLGERGVEVAPVTIDNSEWIFARAYDEALDRADEGLARRLGAAYVDYMIAVTAYYEDQSRAILVREIPQVLLLHANALNADYLPGLVEAVRERGYRFVDLATALADPAFDAEDTYVGPAGITWLHRWAIGRELDPAIFAGEPTTPAWVQDVAGIRE